MLKVFNPEPVTVSELTLRFVGILIVNILLWLVIYEFDVSLKVMLVVFPRTGFELLTVKLIFAAVNPTCEDPCEMD